MRALVIGIALLTVIGLGLLAWEANAPAEPAGTPAITAPHGVPADVRSEPRPSEPDADAGLPADAAESSPTPAPRMEASRKYRYLMADLELTDERRTRILELLAQREALAPPLSPEGLPTALPAGNAQRLAEVEEELRAALPRDAYPGYEMYRDSDAEQQQLDQYSAQLRGIASLSATKERRLLDIKLEQKREFSRLLTEAGIDRPTLSAVERQHALTLIDQGLRDYREGYLAEVTPLLDARQHAALSDLENAAFQAELERLQRVVNTR